MISNTTIAVSNALIDRMDETAKGPNLRDWCQRVGLLATGQDFADQHARGVVSVRTARSFITNYVLGRSIAADFETIETTPVLCPTGEHDEAWEELIERNPDLWNDQQLFEAGQEFALLVSAQRDAFTGKKNVRPDHPDKALNMAVVAAWSYVTGVLVGTRNDARLRRHFGLRTSKGSDP